MNWETLFPIAVFVGLPFIIALVLIVVLIDRRKRNRS
jgi:hypothetical protein